MDSFDRDEIKDMLEMNGQLSWVSSQGSKKFLERLMEGANAQRPPQTSLSRSASVPPNRLDRTQPQPRNTPFTKHNSAPSASSVSSTSSFNFFASPSPSASAPTSTSTSASTSTSTSSSSSSKSQRRSKRNATVLEEEFEAIPLPPHVSLESVESLIRNVSRSLNEGAAREEGSSNQTASSEASSSRRRPEAKPRPSRLAEILAHKKLGDPSISSRLRSSSGTLQDRTNKRSRDERSPWKGKGREVIVAVEGETNPTPMRNSSPVAEDTRMASPPFDSMPPPPSPPLPRIHPGPKVNPPTSQTRISPISSQAAPPPSSSTVPRPGTQRSLGMKGPPTSRFKMPNSVRSGSAGASTSRRQFKVPFQPPSAVAPAVKPIESKPKQQAIPIKAKEESKAPAQGKDDEGDEMQTDQNEKSYSSSDYSFGLDSDALDDAMRDFDD